MMGIPQLSGSNEGPEENSTDNSQANETGTGRQLQRNPAEPNAGPGKKKARRSERRILSRPDGVISEIEDATYTVLRKHEKESS